MLLANASSPLAPAQPITSTPQKEGKQRQPADFEGVSQSTSCEQKPSEMQYSEWRVQRCMGWGIIQNATSTAVICMYKHNRVSMRHQGLLFFFESLKVMFLFKHFAKKTNSNYFHKPSSVFHYWWKTSCASYCTKAYKMPLSQEKFRTTVKVHLFTLSINLTILQYI